MGRAKGVLHATATSQDKASRRGGLGGGGPSASTAISPTKPMVADYRTHPIRQYPDMALRATTRAVAPEGGDFVFACAFGARMCEIVEAADALGLAAPQLGCGLRVFAFRRPDGVVVTAINPVLESGGDEAVGIEGCLSLGQLLLPVSRPRTAQMRALGSNGEEYLYEASDLWARVLLHEHDHLQGRLIIDITTNPSLLLGLSRDPQFGFVLPPPEPFLTDIRQYLREARRAEAERSASAGEDPPAT